MYEKCWNILEMYWKYMHRHMECNCHVWECIVESMHVADGVCFVAFFFNGKDMLHHLTTILPTVDAGTVFWSHFVEKTINA